MSRTTSVQRCAILVWSGACEFADVSHIFSHAHRTGTGACVLQMDFLQNTVKLSVYDVVRFPAYFSSPLEKVIEPRVVFLEVRERAGAPE